MLLFVNPSQAKVLTGREDPEQAARVLTAWYPQVVIKLGGDGAIYYANGHPQAHAPAPPVDRVIDGTGAGDAFAPGSCRRGWTRSHQPKRSRAATA